MNFALLKPLPAVETLRAAFSYDPETGLIVRRSTNSRAFNTKTKDGYLWGIWMHERYFAHRIAWAIHYGSAPSISIDHINGEKADNRIENLRLATTSQNNSNAGSRVGSSSPYLGVCWDAAHQKWRAQITKNGIRHYIGIFQNEEDAASAYDTVARELHGEFARANSVAR